MRYLRFTAVLFLATGGAVSSSGCAAGSQTIRQDGGELQNEVNALKAELQAVIELNATLTAEVSALRAEVTQVGDHTTAQQGGVNIAVAAAGGMGLGGVAVLGLWLLAWRARDREHVAANRHEMDSYHESMRQQLASLLGVISRMIDLRMAVISTDNAPQQRF